MAINRIFWTIGEHSYLVYYPIVSYQRIKVYRVERMGISLYFRVDKSSVCPPSLWTFKNLLLSY